MNYLSQPALSRTHLFFISEEDLWSVPLTDLNGIATRLTMSQGLISSPKVSPDGAHVVVASEDEGHCELYVLPSEGGSLFRITYLGGVSYPLSWIDNETILFRSNAKHPHQGFEFFKVHVDGGTSERMEFGEGSNIVCSSYGVVIERNMNRPDPAHWKRYRGGTMGQLWVGRDFDSEFQKLDRLSGNLSCPRVISDRIYYLSDETGLSRIYSCNFEGQDQRAHGQAFRSEFYFRNLETNGSLLVCQSGGDLLSYDPETDLLTQLWIKTPTDRAKASRKSVNGSLQFSRVSLQPQGEKTVVEVRGKVFSLGHWSGPARQLGHEKQTRYKCADWLYCGKRVVLIADNGLQEFLQVFNNETGHLESSFALDGRTLEIKASPRFDQVLTANHKNELCLVDLNTKSVKSIHQNAFKMMEGYNWSPDGSYVVFCQSLTRYLSKIAVYEVATGKIFPISEGQFQDFSPAFDRDGNYIFFLSRRGFNPSYDDVLFDMGFPKAGLPMLVVLKKDKPSPFILDSTLPDQFKKVPEVAVDFKNVSCQIDFEGISSRILQFPVAEAKYTKIEGSSQKVLWSYQPVEGAITLHNGPPDTTGKEYLDCFDFMSGKFEYFGTTVSSFQVRYDSHLRLVQSGCTFKLHKAFEKPDDTGFKGEASPKTGILDLARLNSIVEPEDEWTQMFNDAWRMQKEYFWRDDFNGLNWQEVYSRYEQLLPKIRTRREFSDLLWEMQGELGTSHAYVTGGDLSTGRPLPMGGLGAEFRWMGDGYELIHIHRGDQWARDSASPFLSPGLLVREGDILLELAGHKLTADFAPERAALGLSGQQVYASVRSQGIHERREVRIKLLSESHSLHYREWVNEKRELVKKMSKGRLGYIHIPNMVGRGYAEFHRNFLLELECDGLVVDVRYNGGGHVSQLLIDRLARRPLGTDETRWLGSKNFPYETPSNVVVAVCNEFAGSDGDIFSHTFKLKKLGTLVGTRTWGGVVGIWPRTWLVDGGNVTSPEFGHSFFDVGHGLENNGAEPDINVSYPPHAWRRGQDPQLEVAIDVALKALS